MNRDVGMEGSSTVLMFGKARALGMRYLPVNDNGTAPKVKTVTVRGKLDKSGVAVKVKVPVSEYYGVAVATSISEEGVLTSSIELLHEDTSLIYKVFEETGNHNVVAEWQNWGRKLRLPLYIRSGDGSLMPYSQQVDGVMVGQDHSRRKFAGETNRRPRFLNRRKPGGESA